MNLYLQQIKSLLYKNYKIKRRNHLFLSIFCELLIVSICLGILSLINNENEEHFSEKSNTNLVPINNLVMDKLYGTIGFVIPSDSNCIKNREIFINNLTNNKVFLEYNFKYKIFDDINSYNNYKQDLNNESLKALAIFNKCFTDYTIRVPKEFSVDPSSGPIDKNYRDNSQIFKNNYLLIFSPLQAIINQAIIQTETNKMVNIDFNIGQLGQPETDLVYNIGIKPIGYSLMFIMEILKIMTSIMKEKDKGIEQGLIAIGVHPSSIWLSWEIFNLPIIIIISILVVLNEMESMFLSINFILGFILIFAYGLSLYGFSVIMSKIFKKSKTAILTVFLYFFCIFFIEKYLYELESNYPIVIKSLYVIFSPLNFIIILIKLIEKKENEFIIHLILLICSVIFYHLIILVVEFFSYKSFNLFKRKGDFTQVIHMKMI